MRIHLIVLNAGKLQGGKIPITVSKFMIGRGLQCHLRPASASIGKLHCALRFRNGLLYVHDFKTLNGTWLNDQRVTREVQAENGDVLRVGPLAFRIELTLGGMGPIDEPRILDLDYEIAQMLTSFQEDEKDNKGIYAVFDGSTPIPTEAPLTPRRSPGSQTDKVRRLAPHRGSVEEELGRIQEAIIYDHLYYPESDGLRLTQRLLDSGSLEYEKLSHRFHRLVVLDVSKGMDGTGTFDITLFLRHVLGQMAEAFELQIDENAFHPERIGQILKDEQMSLFCFLHVEHLSESSFHVLHGFTQQEHRVLYFGRNDYLLKRSFALADKSDTYLAAKAILDKYTRRPRGT